MGSIFATLHTSAGAIRIELFPNHSPKTVANFVELAEGTKPYTDPRTGTAGSGPYYNGVTFHRVIANFMIQGGDPTGRGSGGPGFTIPDEFHSELLFNRPYLLAMANTGRPNSGSAQFFITVSNPTHLNHKHTIFGEVADEASKRVVKSISVTPTAADRPVQDVIIERVEIERT